MPLKIKKEPKKTRSKSPKSRQKINWREELTNRQIQCKSFETNWSASIVMLAETEDALSTKYVRRFVESTHNGSRYEIKAIDNRVITDNIAKYTKRSELYEEAASLQTKKGLSDVELQAFLIKDAILIFKEEDLDRMDAKTGWEHHKSESGVEKIGQKEDVQDNIQDGANLYITLVGFYDINLILQLMNIGVLIQTVVYVSPKKNDNQKNIKQTKPTTYALSSKLTFWESLVDCVTNSLNDNYVKFNKLGLIIYEPDYTDEMTKNIVADKTRIYEEITMLLYDIQEILLQYNTHLESMSIIEIPDYDPEQISIKNIYDALSSNKPSEVTTVPVIVNNMIDALSIVTASDNLVQSNIVHNDLDEKYKLSQKHSLSCDYLNSNNKIRDNFLLLKNSKISVEQLLKFEYNDIKNPTIISYGNFAQELSYHLEDNDVEQCTIYYLREMPVPLLWNKYRNHRTDHIIFNDYFMNQFKLFFPNEKISLKMIKRYFYLLCCKKLYNQQFKENHSIDINILQPPLNFLKRTLNAAPFNLNEKTSITTHAQSKKIEELPDEISLEFDDEELYKSKDILNITLENNNENTEHTTFHHINDYIVFNEMNFSVMLQAINNAYKTFNCIRYKYLGLTDSIVLLFLNKKNYLRENIYDWKTNFPTPISFQDFLLTNLKKKNYPIEQTETEYLNQFYPKTIDSVVDGKLNDITIKDAEPLELPVSGELTEEFDSLQQLFPLMKSIQRTPKILSSANFFTNVEHIGFDSPNENILSRERIKSNLHKNSKSHTPETKIPSKMNKIKLPRKKYLKFLAYNIHNGPINHFGITTTFFSKDGTEVTIRKRRNTMDNKESLMVEVSLNKHRIILHKEFFMNFVGKHFRISSTNGIELTFVENIVEVQNKDTLQKINVLEKGETEKHDHFNLFMSWPNGLMVQTVKVKGADFPFYIKQSLYNQDNPRLKKEKFRCISRNGEVLIFYTCGIVSVLRSDGTKYVCHTFSDHTSTLKTKTETHENTPTNGSESKFSVKPFGFLITQANGQRYEIINDQIVSQSNALPVSIAIDSKLGEVYVKRKDKTSMLLKKNGVQVTKFVDGTKIITYYVTEADEYFVEWTDEEINLFQKNRTDAFIMSDGEDFSYKVKETPFVVISMIYIIEHPYYSTIVIDHSMNTMKIQMPENQYIVIKNDDDYKVHLDDSTVIQISGKEIRGNYTACQQCRSYTQAVINLDCLYSSFPLKISNLSIPLKVPSSNKNKTTSVTDKTVPLDRKENPSLATKYSPPLSSVESSPPILLKLLDCFGTIFIVDTNGECTTTKAESQDEDMIGMVGRNSDLQTEHQVSGKCGTFAACSDRRRYFVLHRDLSGEEFFYKSEYEQSLKAAKEVAWSSVIERKSDFDPGCKFAHILKPVQSKNATKRWLMESSKWASSPTRLVNCDLLSFSEDISWMELWPGTVTDWQRPVVNPIAPPKVFSLRVLQKIDDPDWFRKCMIASTEFIKATNENYSKYSTLPDLLKSSNDQKTQQAEQEWNALRFIKTSKIVDSDPKQSPLLKAQDMFPPAICRYLDRRWMDILDQTYFMQVLRLRVETIPDYFRDEGEVYTPSQITRMSNVQFEEDTVIPGEGMGAKEEPAADVEVQTSFGSSIADVDVFSN